MRIFAPVLATLVLLAAACSDDPAAAPKPGTDGGGGGEGGPPSPDGGKGPVSDKVNVTTETLDVGSDKREYVLAVPKKYEEGRPYPLVLVFHGDGGTGPGMRDFHLFDAYSGDEAIVAYPTGLGQAWDIYTPSDSNADMKFVDALVAALSKKYTVDDARIFATGYSSGAFLINKIACRKTGFFRAIVPYAGGAPDESQDPKAGIWPSGFTKCAGQTGGIAAMVVHGADDTAVTPDSGDFTATYWASLNGCGTTRSEASPSPCVKYDGCPANEPVLYCLIPGLGHTVWDQGAKEGWAFMKEL